MLLAGSLRGPELYDLAQGKQLPAFGPGGNGEQPVLFSPDGKYLATAYQHSLRLWETATRKPVREIAGHEREVYAVSFAPDGRTIVSAAGEFGTVHRWETATGKELPPWDSIQDGVYGLAYSADGRMLAVGTSNHDGTVWLLEPATGTLIRKLTIPKGRVTSVAFSADGRVLAGKYQDQTHVWDVATGKRLHSFQEGGNSITEVALSPDGRRVASGNEDGIIRLWEAATGKAVCQLGGHQRGVHAVAFSPAGRVLVSGGNDKTVRVWDLATATHLWCAEGHEEGVRWVAVSPDGKTVASGGMDRSVRLWEVATGKERQRFDGHRHGVRSGAFSPDNQRLATGSYDTTVLVWDLTGRAGKRPAEPLSSEDLTRFWSDLASEDAARAYHAIRTLVLDPGQSVPLLQEQLQPAALVEAKRLGRLIADLDSEQFEVRQRASEELERVGEQAEPALRTALAGEPAPEARRRMERLLGKLVGPFTSLDQLRTLRAVEVLESIGSTEARRVLEKLSSRTAEARLSREAKAALGRLERRSATTP
jgi:WD40 repeat protein